MSMGLNTINTEFASIHLVQHTSNPQPLPDSSDLQVINPDHRKATRYLGRLLDGDAPKTGVEGGLPLRQPTQRPMP